MNYREVQSKIIKIKNRFNVYYHVNINDNRMQTGAALKLRRMYCLGEFNTCKKMHSICSHTSGQTKNR